MSELGRWWRDAPFLRHRPAPLEEPAPVVGLVLSGGGARSSFQIGALRYLYDVVGITPSAISGTSAGAILAAVLAQHGDHAGQRAALSELERIWLGMRGSSDMFTELPWFARLREHMPAWRKVLTLGQRSARAAEIGADQEPGGRNGAHADEPAHTPAWSPSTALETLATIWEVGRSSADLQTIVRGPTQERAAFTPGPFVDRLLEPQVFDRERLARSPVKLRVAVVGLETGELRYVTNDGSFRDRVDRELAVEPADVVEAIRASCAIPGVFPPVTLGTEHFVDGGVRENLPVQIAREHLGVTEGYAVVASPSGVPPRETFAKADLFEIVMRSASGIMSDELQRDEIAYALSHGMTVISPTVDIHDLVTIDPGLISIAVDYGYLRAQDVVTGAPPERQRLTDDLIRLRKLAWEAEEAVFGQQTGSEEEVRTLKYRLRDLLAQVPPSDLPKGSERWWQGWERHAFEIDQEIILG